jgi:LCP family protein required for cell wall assembly
MSPDPVLALLAARNPVPDPDALSSVEREAADSLRISVRSAPPPRRSDARRYLLIAACAVLPVAAVVVLALGIHSSRHPAAAAAPAPRPQTILVIGSDRVPGASARSTNTDTILLVRLDPNSRTINVLSIPRDLKVHLPNGAAKLNAAYFSGGPQLLIKTLRGQVLPGLAVNHVVDVNLSGFADVVDAIGCVYADIDHRYYNHTALTDYSSIDIEPGYQKLCGQNSLQFIRFRHTDSDLVRDQRVMDFVRWAGQRYPVAEARANLSGLATILEGHVVTDQALRTRSGLRNLMALVAATLGRPLEQVPFPAVLAPCGGANSQAPCYVTAKPAAEAAAYRQLVTPTAAAPPASTPAVATPATAGLVADPADGQAQAAALRGSGLSVLYPRLIEAGSHYCSSASGNCPLEAADPHAYPRVYRIEAGGRAYPAYRMTLVVNPSLGEYYGVQGTTWTDPPILANPTRTASFQGKKLLEFYNAGKLSLVAWKSPGAAYWVSNTLTDSIPAGRLLGIAASLQPAP